MKFNTLIYRLSCNTHPKICGLIHSDNARISTNTLLGWFSKATTIQCLVWPPAHWITARQFCHLIERKYPRITFIGLLFHSCTNACWSWCNICAYTGRWCTRLSSRSHTCFIGNKSGDFHGHSMYSSCFPADTGSSVMQCVSGHCLTGKWS